MLKDELLYVQTFDTVEDLRHALLAFCEIYSTIWLIHRHGFQSAATMWHERLQRTGLAA